MYIFLCIHMNIYVQQYSAYLCTAMRTRSSNVMALDMFATMSRMEAASKIARSAWSSHGCVHFIHQRRNRSYVYISIWVSFHLHVCLFCIENGGCKQDGAVCVIFGFALYSMTHFTCLFALQHTATHCNTLQHTAPWLISHVRHDKHVTSQMRHDSHFVSATWLRRDLFTIVKSLTYICDITHLYL